MVEVKGKGKFRGMDAKLYVSGGALLALRRADRPYPIKAILTLGKTRASINGTLLDPLHLKKEKVNFVLEGNDLAQLYPIIGVPFPPTPALQADRVPDPYRQHLDIQALRGESGKERSDRRSVGGQQQESPN